jgi:hypothetical protein
MATLNTLGLGTFTNLNLTAIVGTDPVLEEIASADDADYAYTATNAAHVARAEFTLEDVNADLGNVDTLFVRLRYAIESGSQLNLWNLLSARVFKSDGTTPLTDGATVASNITTSTPTNSSVIEFTGVDTAAEKADWDAAVVVLFLDVTKVKGGDTLQKRVFAAELTGTYTAAGVGVNGAVDLSGSGTVASLAKMVRHAVAALTGSGTPAASGKVVVHGSADLSGVGAFAGQGTVAGGAVTGQVDLPGSGAIAASGTRIAHGSTDLSGSGLVAASGKTVVHGQTDVSGQGQLAASGKVTVHPQSDLAGAGSIATAGKVVVYGASDLAGTGVFAANAEIVGDNPFGQVDLPGSGVIAASGKVILHGSSDEAGAGSFDSAAKAVRHAVAVLAVAAILEASGKTIVYGVSDISGQGAFAAVSTIPSGVLVNRIRVTARVVHPVVPGSKDQQLVKVRI